MGFSLAIRLAAGLAIAAATASALAAPAAGASYRIRSIGASTSAFAINDNGDVTGCFRSLELRDDEAYLFRRGRLVDLSETLGGVRSCGLGLNAAGDLVGIHDSSDFATSAFLMPHGTRKPRDIVGRASSAEDVNDAGQVVGAGVSFGQGHAYLWADGAARDLGTLGGRSSFAKATAAPDQAVGGAQTATGATHAFLFRAGGMRDLGTLGGAFSVALDVNADDHVVGEARLATNGLRAFMWTPGGGMHGLGGLVPGRLSIANGINAQDVVVGSAFVARGDAHAFVWTVAAGMRDLNELIPPGRGWLLLEATAINSAGQIVGNALRNGVPTAFLLTPS